MIVRKLGLQASEERESTRCLGPSSSGLALGPVVSCGASSHPPTSGSWLRQLMRLPATGL